MTVVGCWISALGIGDLYDIMKEVKNDEYKGEIGNDIATIKVFYYSC